MIEIRNAAKYVADILGKAKVENNEQYVPSLFNKLVDTDDGVLLFNTFTKKLLFLNELEKNYYFNFDLSNDFCRYLVENYFYVKKDMDEIKSVDNARNLIKILKSSPDITKYTIMTTTDCNARCFYCYEMGRSRMPMNEETAMRLVDYIASHNGNRLVSLAWFGGEPLYNSNVIDIITSGLKNRNIEYESTMISNGYLFDEECVKKAKKEWMLKKVQISLDGTEEVYNRCKAYIYKNDISPYRIVLDNIERLLNEKIAVNIRLNMEKHNLENLYELIDELGNRFNRLQPLRIYVARIFDNKSIEDDSEIAVVDDNLIDDQINLIKHIDSKGLLLQNEVAKELKISKCIADDPNSVVVAPDGRIGKCEHYSESEFIGSLDSNTFDMNVINKWSKQEVYEKCNTCIHYPNCFNLKHCPDYPNYCNEKMIHLNDYWLEKEIMNTYMIYKFKSECEEQK